MSKLRLRGLIEFFRVTQFIGGPNDVATKGLSVTKTHEFQYKNPEILRYLIILKDKSFKMIKSMLQYWKQSSLGQLEVHSRSSG